MGSFKLFVIFILLVTGINASQPPPSHVKIKSTIQTILVKYGISASTPIQIEQQATRTPDSVKWNTNLTRIFITEDMADRASLLEFTAHCAAAYLSNNSFLKNTTAGLATAFVPALALGSASTASSNGPVLGTIAGSALTWFCNSKLMLGKRIEDYFLSQAYIAACKKLLEENQVQTIAEYAAYSLLIDHRPLTNEKRMIAIKGALEEAGYFLEAEYKKNPKSCTLSIKESNGDAVVAKSIIKLTDANSASFKFDEQK